MGNLKSWSLGIKKEIENKRDKIYKRDFKFFKIDRLVRIAEHVDVFSETCDECKTHKEEIEQITEKLSEFLNGTPRQRGEYEKRSEVLVKHLKEKHNLVQAEYFSAVYALAGFASGLILGGGIFYLIHPDFFKMGLLGGFTIGIISGRIIGKRKDKQKKKENLIL